MIVVVDLLDREVGEHDLKHGRRTPAGGGPAWPLGQRPPAHAPATVCQSSKAKHCSPHRDDRRAAKAAAGAFATPRRRQNRVRPQALRAARAPVPLVIRPKRARREPLQRVAVARFVVDRASGLSLVHVRVGWAGNAAALAGRSTARASNRAGVARRWRCCSPESTSMPNARVPRAELA